MEERARQLVEQHIEFHQLIQKTKETGIREHLSDTAIMLMFLALGSKMWKEKKKEKSK